MEFTLTEEQHLFQATLREFVDTHIRPVAREWEHSGRYPTEPIERMKDMGLFGMNVPAQFGGLDLSLVSMALVFEELSRGWLGVAGALGTHSVACWMITHYGTEDQKNRLLPELATGRRRAALALTEPDAGSDLQGIKTRATLVGDHYVVRGTKIWVTNARHADPLPVLVKTNPEADPAHHGMSVLLVDQGTEGFEVTRDMGKLGYRGLESCEVVFDEARVPVENLLGGKEGKGMQQVLSGLEIGRINIAARAVGVSQEALDQALAYARKRHAFGRPIADFQAIQLKIADMASRVQAARLLTYWAASRGDEGRRIDAEAGMAKYFASETALTCSLESMRIHGGSGYSTELDIERLYRDAPLMAIGEGTNDIQRILIGRALLDGRVTLGR